MRLYGSNAYSDAILAVCTVLLALHAGQSACFSFHPVRLGAVQCSRVQAARSTSAPSAGLRGNSRCSWWSSTKMHASGEWEVNSQERRKILLSTLHTAAFAAASLSQPAQAKAAGETVLVVGATSTMGQETCKDLIALGYKVRGFTRRAEDVQKAVQGTEFAAVEWVNGNLNEFSDLSSAMKGVKKVIFAPLLATRAGSDPEYFKTNIGQDIELNKAVFSDAVGELVRLGQKEGVDKFVLVSSAGVGKPASVALDEARNRADEAKGRWRPTRLEPAMLNEDVIKWKLRGESALKESGLPYTIVRAYSPPPRPWNDPRPEDFNIAILQGSQQGVSGVITRADLGHVAALALASDSTTGTTFEAIDVPKSLPPEQLAVVQQMSPKFPQWKDALASLRKDPPASQLAGAVGGDARGREAPAKAVAKRWDGDTLIVGSSK